MKRVPVFEDEDEEHEDEDENDSRLPKICRKSSIKKRKTSMTGGAAFDRIRTSRALFITSGACTQSSGCGEI